MSIWGRDGGSIGYGLPASRPCVELRKRKKNGCAHRNWVRLTDAPNVPCFVCGHQHGPISFGVPFCLYCAFAVMRDSSASSVDHFARELETLVRHGRH